MPTDREIELWFVNAMGAGNHVTALRALYDWAHGHGYEAATADSKPKKAKNSATGDDLPKI